MCLSLYIRREKKKRIHEKNKLTAAKKKHIHNTRRVRYKSINQTNNHTRCCGGKKSCNQTSRNMSVHIVVLIFLELNRVRKEEEENTQHFLEKVLCVYLFGFFLLLLLHLPQSVSLFISFRFIVRFFIYFFWVVYYYCSMLHCSVRSALGCVRLCVLFISMTFSTARNVQCYKVKFIVYMVWFCWMVPPQSSLLLPLL